MKENAYLVFLATLFAIFIVSDCVSDAMDNEFKAKCVDACQGDAACVKVCIE